MEFNIKKITLTENPGKLNICGRYEGIEECTHVSDVWFVVRFLNVIHVMSWYVYVQWFEVRGGMFMFNGLR